MVVVLPAHKFQEVTFMAISSGQILVLEDDPVWQRIYEEIASDMGYTVHIADNAKDALTKLARRLCHLVIVDLSLVPDNPRNRDGMEVLNWIRLMNEGTQGLVCTGYATPKDARDAFKEGGAFDFVWKGVGGTEIATKIRQGIAQAQASIMARPVYPRVGVKGLELSEAANTLGTPWDKLEHLLAALLYRANELLEVPEQNVGEGPTTRAYEELASLTLPRLLDHRRPAKVLARTDGAIIVTRYWDRVFERPLVVRLRQRSHVEREYDFFASHPGELRTMGFAKIGRPCYEGDLGGIVYVADESDSPFEEFEPPWPLVLSGLQSGLLQQGL
jgi:CheY-like chemotaxis protein